VSNVKVISLGGSIIAPDGVDFDFLNNFRRTIEAYLAEDEDRRLILVCGGGGPAREYQKAYRRIMAEPVAEAQDWIGIAATRLNGELVRQLFAQHCPERVVTDPTALTLFPGRIMVAAGWKPGFSTDYDAVLLAKKFQADTVINLSNIAQVFTADPKSDPNAKALESLTWDEFRKLVGHTWTPGKNVPFDPIATDLAAGSGLLVIVAAGRDLENLKKILADEDFIGTTIGPE
jgi:uridylate kinase